MACDPSRLVPSLDLELSQQAWGERIIGEPKLKTRFDGFQNLGDVLSTDEDDDDDDE